MILILAKQGDLLAEHVSQVLAQRGLAAVSVDPDRPWHPLRWEMSAAAASAAEHHGLTQLNSVGIHGQRVTTGDLSGVLVRGLPAPGYVDGMESDAQYLQLEWLSALVGLLAALPCPVINRCPPLRSYRQPWLAACGADFRAAGLALPDMLVTDSAEEAAEFRARHAGRVVCPLGPAQCLAAVPAGTQRRVFVVGDEAFGAPADTPLPTSLFRRCVAAAQSIGLRFAELLVVSNREADTVLELAELPLAAGCSTELASRLAPALARLLAPRRERKCA